MARQDIRLDSPLALPFTFLRRISDPTCAAYEDSGLARTSQARSCFNQSMMGIKKTRADADFPQQFAPKVKAQRSLLRCAGPASIVDLL